MGRGGRMRIFAIHGETLVPYRERRFGEENLEKDLEEWLEKNPSCLLEENLLIIGRQVTTNLGSTVDLLGIDRDGNTVVIELKRSSVPRETLAQALEYASFAQLLTYEDLERIFQEYMGGEGVGLSEYHRRYFALGEDESVAFNRDQRVVVVGESIPREIRQVAALLRGKGVDISCVEFKLFEAPARGRFIVFETVVGRASHPMRRTPSSVPRSPVTREEFLRPLDGEARGLFTRIFDFAEENGLCIRWGSVGFSLCVPLEGGAYVSILEGYPESSSFGHNVLYVPLSGIARKVEDGESVARLYAGELARFPGFTRTEKGLKSPLKDLRENLEAFLAVLLAVAEKIRRREQA